MERSKSYIDSYYLRKSKSGLGNNHDGVRKKIYASKMSGGFMRDSQEVNKVELSNVIIAVESIKTSIEVAMQ